MNKFEEKLLAENLELIRGESEILQINVGKLCNLTCSHCHVNAGPNRKEIITRETIDSILDWLEKSKLSTVDLTGGAPEMIPDFRYFVEEMKKLDFLKRIIIRCNLTILVEPGFEWLPEFFKEHQLEVVASLPCYSSDNVDEQRGDGVFHSSIKALNVLNKLGYGRTGNLLLNLVYNPNGTFLPPEQSALEADYKKELKEQFEIEFNHLFAITNIPVGRYTSYLKRNDEYASYMTLLEDNFNSSTIPTLMCRNTINVDWQGRVFDCDFNQMQKMPLGENGDRFLWDLDLDELISLKIKTGSHCFGCTAGTGSSCGGALV